MTRKLLVTTLAISLLTAAGSVAAPVKMEVSLSISPNTTLPGLSVPLHLRVRNGGRALELAPTVRVRATSPAGESFSTSWDQHLTAGELEFGLTDEEDTRFVLPANGTVDLEVPAVDLMQQSWAHDSRLVALPGEWTLEVLLYEVADTPQRNPDPVGVSNPAKLTIETPTGGDVPVWQAILAGEARPIAEKVLTQQPESRYFPYLSTMISRYSTLDKVAIINRAIELHPHSPVIPALRYGIALYYGSEADRVFVVEEDFEKAVALAEKGRAELMRLKNGKGAWSRLKGNAKLGDFPSREYFAELQRLTRRNATQKQ